MHIRYLLWQCIGLIAVLIIFAIFATPVFWIYLQYSLIAILVCLALAPLVPQSYRRYFASRRCAWDVVFPIGIAVVCAVLRINGKELQLEYLLPARVALSLLHGRDKKMNHTN